MEIKNLIVFPDIHGRDFWKQYINSLSQEEIQQTLFVFLGDYLDPYEHEKISDLEALYNFNEIIEFKKNNPNNVILLLGNHDCSYVYNKDICNCRYCTRIANEVISIFKDNYKLFQIAYEINYAGKHYVFSHAGIHNNIIDLLNTSTGQGLVYENNVVDRMNEMYLDDMSDYTNRNRSMFSDILGYYSVYRGPSPYKFGSPIWADIREWYSSLYDEFNHIRLTYQIFGHTQLRDKPIIGPEFACIDCRRPFKITENGIEEV